MSKSAVALEAEFKKRVADSYFDRDTVAVKPADTTPKKGVFDDIEVVALKCGKYEKMFSKLLGFKPTLGPDFPVPTFFHKKSEWWSKDVPELNEFYIWPKTQTEQYLRAIVGGDKAQLVGAPGTGKTDLVRNVAALTGRPFFRFNFNIDTASQDVFGEVRIQVEEGVGVTKYKEADIPKVWRGPYLLLLDEWSRMPSGIALIFQRALESNDGCLYLPEKEGDNIIPPHKDLVITSADNAKGLGDMMDKYTSTNVQDISTLDRFEMTIEFDYLPYEQEVELLKKWEPTLPPALASEIIRFAELVRTAFSKGELSLTLSPRGLKPISKYTMTFRNPIPAIRYCFFNKLADEHERAAVSKFCQTAFADYNTWGEL